jgi:hypothetical protein
MLRCSSPQAAPSVEEYWANDVAGVQMFVEVRVHVWFVVLPAQPVVTKPSVKLMSYVAMRTSLSLPSRRSTAVS